MTKAIFWIATSSYINEARQSADSVAKYMPEVDRILFSPDATMPDIFNLHYTLPSRKYYLWYLDFVTYLNDTIGMLKEYSRLLYLDTDIYMCYPVPELFDLLDYFDIASTHAPARQISPTTKKIPECFSEYNTGVLAFRNNADVRDLFAKWLALYEANPDLYKENDQAPLRECLLDWPGQSYVLPPEYNCRFGFGGQVAGKIKILHGRSDNMPLLAEKINADNGIRGWRRGDFS